MACKHKAQQAGFVLPYVLVAVAILAAVTIFVAQNLSRGTDTLTRLEQQANIDLAFFAAEGDALYWLLRAVPDVGGYQHVREVSRRGLGEYAPIGVKWGIKGDMRRIETSYGPVFVSLQDVSGLISLRGVDALQFREFMGGFGIAPSEASRLFATLKDYTDPDSRRQFQGAEAIDYRQRGLPPPTNAGLRSFSELPRILGWPEALEKIDMARFENFTSLTSRVTVFREANMSSALAEHLSARAALRDRRANFLESDSYPSRVFRLTYEMPMIDAEGRNAVRRRVVEYTRSVNQLTAPVNKIWISDRTVLDSAAFERFNGASILETG